MTRIPLILLTFLFGSFILQAQNSEIDVERQWSSYRGYYAKGILDHTNLPENWDIKTNKNIKWKADIPG